MVSRVVYLFMVEGGLGLMLLQMLLQSIEHSLVRGSAVGLKSQSRLFRQTCSS